jgi:hypothetical protein
MREPSAGSYGVISEVAEGLGKTPHLGDRVKRERAVPGTDVYRVLLMCFPGEFRQAYGDSMIYVFEEGLANAVTRSGWFGFVAFWLFTLGDLAKAISAEQVSFLAARSGIERKSSLGVSLAIHGLVLVSLIWMGIHAVHPVRNSCETLAQHSPASKSRPFR